MTIYEFNTQFCDELEKAVQDMGGDVSIGFVPKNNVLMQTATIRFGDNPAGVVVYPERYYADWKSGVPMQDIIEGVREAVTQARIPDFNIEGITHENAREHLRSAVVNYESNKEWLKNIPHERVQDLAVFAKWHFGGDYAARISNPLLHQLQMTKEEVLDMAKLNSAKSAQFMRLDDVIKGFYMDMPEDLSPGMEPELPESPLFVLCTKEQADGAALIAAPDILKKIHEEVGDFYILPSSVHELLISPLDRNPMKPGELKKMVQTVNDTEVAVQDRLSNNVYEFDGKSLKIAGMDGLNEDIGITDTFRHRRSR